MKATQVTVKVKKGQTKEEKDENFNRAMKLFKKKVNGSGHLLEHRQRQEYQKPSVNKRMVKLAAKREQSNKTLLEIYENTGDELVLMKNYKKNKRN